MAVKVKDNVAGHFYLFFSLTLLIYFNYLPWIRQSISKGFSGFDVLFNVTVLLCNRYLNKWLFCILSYKASHLF